MTFGEIYWLDLPDRAGREQRGRRPCLIWQDTDHFPAFATVLVIPFTSNLKTLRLPATVRVDPTRRNGLSTPLAALVFQLGAADVRRVGIRMGVLAKRDLEKIALIARRLQRLESA